MKKISNLKIRILLNYGSLRAAAKALQIPYTRLSVLVNEWEEPNADEYLKLHEYLDEGFKLNKGDIDVQKESD